MALSAPNATLANSTWEQELVLAHFVYQNPFRYLEALLAQTANASLDGQGRMERRAHSVLQSITKQE